MLTIIIIAVFLLIFACAIGVVSAFIAIVMASDTMKQIKKEMNE